LIQNSTLFEGPRGDVVQKRNWLYPSNQVQAGIMIRSVALQCTSSPPSTASAALRSTIIGTAGMKDGEEILASHREETNLQDVDTPVIPQSS
jgi:hypothetical protein